MTQQKAICVLVAEDDYLVSEMIQGLLEELGYVVIGAARDGVQAIELRETLQPDVLLIDIHMPKIDGLTAAKQIQQANPLPIVILTAYETIDLVEQASEAGAGAYLIKPPNGREMERAITIAMARFNDMATLRQLNLSLQAYNEELDAFAHTVAHDLQNPLSLIMGFAELLCDDFTDFSESEITHYLKTIRHSAGKMSNIIDELLLLAGVRQMEVTMQPLAIDDIVMEALQRLGHQIMQHHTEIVVPDSWPQAMGYGPWVEEVWINYLSNAIKYGGRPPRLELGANVQEDGMVRFWVRDNGKGLSQSDQARLFTPFTKLSQIRVEGHGLGLSIVQRIVEKLGGDVGVESELGQGSAFWFSLPPPPQPPSNLEVQPFSDAAAR